MRFHYGMVFVLLAALNGAACFSSDEGETFYGRVEVRPKQELRWSNGGLPRIFDPALAASAPDTDAVRAIFEGLTEIDPRTFAAVPAVAERWESSEGDRVWTFHLRSDARWSNGEPVTATDFVRAWKRAVALGERVPHRALLANLQGAQALTPTLPKKASNASEMPSASIQTSAPVRSSIPAQPAAEDVVASKTLEAAVESPVQSVKSERDTFGVEAISPRVLRTRLVKPDPNFPALVAHPLFHPLYRTNLKDVKQQGVAVGDETEPNRTSSAASDVTTDRSGDTRSDSATQQPEFDSTISNGAFKLKSRSSSDVVLERSANYHGAQTVALEVVRFVHEPNTEKTLALYRAGEVDVVTNATFEPLTIKLLAPHEDFRRTTFAALNYYVFNRHLPPFDDVRVREAFAIAIDRGQLTRDTLGGATEPANRFLPEPLAGSNAAGSGVDTVPAIRTDRRRARQLLAAAGFPGGSGFPVVRLLINRNDMHRAVAQAVATMWRVELGVETEVVVKDWDEYEKALSSGDYSIARRSNVMQTPDEQSNIELLFALPGEVKSGSSGVAKEVKTNVDALAQAAPSADAPTQTKPDSPASESAPALIATHEQALRELPAIPLYFASSYALVKPYILDFDQTLFDAPLLKRVRINGEWVPPNEKRITLTKRS